MPIRRCPWKLIGDRESAAITEILLFLDKGVMPEEGQLQDQTGTFHDAWPIVAQIRSEHAERRMNPQGAGA